MSVQLSLLFEPPSRFRILLSPKTDDGGAVFGVRGGVFWRWACGASPLLGTGVTLRAPRLDMW